MELDTTTHIISSTITAKLKSNSQMNFPPGLDSSDPLDQQVGSRTEKSNRPSSPSLTNSIDTIRIKPRTRPHSSLSATSRAVKGQSNTPLNDTIESPQMIQTSDTYTVYRIPRPQSATNLQSSCFNRLDGNGSGLSLSGSQNVSLEPHSLQKSITPVGTSRSTTEFNPSRTEGPSGVEGTSLFISKENKISKKESGMQLDPDGKVQSESILLANDLKNAQTSYSVSNNEVLDEGKGSTEVENLSKTLNSPQRNSEYVSLNHTESEIHEIVCEDEISIAENTVEILSEAVDQRLNDNTKKKKRRTKKAAPHHLDPSNPPTTASPRVVPPISRRIKKKVKAGSTARQRKHTPHVWQPSRASSNTRIRETPVKSRDNIDSDSFRVDSHSTRIPRTHVTPKFTSLFNMSDLEKPLDRLIPVSSLSKIKGTISAKPLDGIKFGHNSSGTTVDGTSGVTITKTASQSSIGSNPNRRSRHPRKVVNVAFSKYSLIRKVAQDMGFEVQESEEDLLEGDFNLIWSDTVLPLTRIVRLQSWQRSNHFPSMHLICRKGHLGITLGRVRRILPNHFNYYPHTWSLRSERSQFMRYYVALRQRRVIKYFIVKPNSGCQGRGIIVTRDPLNAVEDPDQYIVQEYIRKPLLIEGRKFDLRVYVLLTSIREPSIFIFNDGLVRICAETYEAPNESNISNACKHLTNYAVNKHSPQFVFNTDADQGDTGNKRDFKFFNAWLAAQKENEADGAAAVKLFWERVEYLIVKTILVAQPAIMGVYNSCFPTFNEGYCCFEVLGFDILVDHKMKPWLMEVNHTPSLSTDTPLDMNIKYGLVSEVWNIIDMQATDQDRYRQREKEDFAKRNCTPNSPSTLNSGRRSTRSSPSPYSRDANGGRPMQHFSPIRRTFQEANSSFSSTAGEREAFIHARRANEDSKLHHFRRIYPSTNPDYQAVYDTVLAQSQSLAMMANSLAGGMGGGSFYPDSSAPFPSYGSMNPFTLTSSLHNSPSITNNGIPSFSSKSRFTHDSFSRDLRNNLNGMALQTNSSKASRTQPCIFPPQSNTMVKSANRNGPDINSVVSLNNSSSQGDQYKKLEKDLLRIRQPSGHTFSGAINHANDKKSTVTTTPVKGLDNDQVMNSIPDSTSEIHASAVASSHEITTVYSSDRSPEAVKRKTLAEAPASVVAKHEHGGTKLHTASTPQRTAVRPRLAPSLPIHHSKVPIDSFYNAVENTTGNLYATGTSPKTERKDAPTNSHNSSLGVPSPAKAVNTSIVEYTTDALCPVSEIAKKAHHGQKKDAEKFPTQEELRRLETLQVLLDEDAAVEHPIDTDDDENFDFDE